MKAELDGLRQVEDHLIEFFRAHRVTFLAGLGLTIRLDGYRDRLGGHG